MNKKCPTCKQEKPLEEFNSSGKYCRLCHNEKNRKWREDNREKNILSHLKYEEKFRVANNTILECSTCKKEKKASEFVWKNKERGIRHNCCKECQAIASRKHYVNNKEKCIKSAAICNRSIKRKLTKKLVDYLREHPCVDCGESRPLRLEFDHVRGKKLFNISDGVKRQFKWDRFIAEIEKCEIRCSNCHAEKTARDGNFLMAQIIDEE